ncbi:MAG: hypothetical protein FJZ79_09990 [Chlorobi bacterium]|nr:hypothetical protein [Chlorobiota bacterium]
MIYLLFGILWILVTDTAAYLFTHQIQIFAMVELVKGWFYVVLSSAVIFYLTREAFRQQDQASKEKANIFYSTIRGAHHVLLNYLNQMQLVTLEAERVEGFDADILKLAQTLSEEASSELRRMGEIRNISPEAIHSEFFRDRQSQC